MATGTKQQPAPPAEAPPKLEPLPQDIFISEKKGLDADAPGLTARDRARLERSSSARR